MEKEHLEKLEQRRAEGNTDDIEDVSNSQNIAAAMCISKKNSVVRCVTTIGHLFNQDTFNKDTSNQDT